MMSAALFAAFAIMTALAVMAVLWPLSRQRGLRDERAADIEVYRDQLAELERDAAIGRLQPDLANAARTEVMRRMLALDAAGAGEQAAPARSRGRRRLAAVLGLVLIPALAVGLYLRLGSPDLPGQPLAARLSAPPDRSDVAILVRKVEDHLAANPNDGQGYQILAPVYLRLGRLDDAVRAYAQAIRLLGPDAEREADYGEALVVQAGGIVTKEAVSAFEAALAAAPGQPKARYYLGRAAEQDGRMDEARETWSQLLADSPPDAPWAGLVRAALAKTGAVPPAAAPAAPQGSVVRRPAAPPASSGLAIPGPSAQDMEAAASMSGADRAAMVQGMVERLEQRLAAAPNDLDGWLRLAHAWRVLGDDGKARAALQTGRDTFAGDAAAAARIDAAAKEMGLEPDPVGLNRPDR